MNFLATTVEQYKGRQYRPARRATEKTLPTGNVRELSLDEFFVARTVGSMQEDGIIHFIAPSPADDDLEFSPVIEAAIHNIYDLLKERLGGRRWEHHTQTFENGEGSDRVRLLTLIVDVPGLDRDGRFKLSDEIMDRLSDSPYPAVRRNLNVIIR